MDLDFAAMEESDLRELLISLGIDDAVTMDGDELLVTAMSISSSQADNSSSSSSQTYNMSQDIEQSNATYNDGIKSTVNSQTSKSNDVYDVDNDDDDMLPSKISSYYKPQPKDTASSASSSYSFTNTDLVNSKTTIKPIAAPKASTSSTSANADADTSLSKDQEEKISSFRDITGADFETATHMLEACDYNFEAALALYIPDSGSGGNTNNGGATGGDGGIGMSEEDSIAAFTAATQRLYSQSAGSGTSVGGRVGTTSGMSSSGAQLPERFRNMTRMSGEMDKDFHSRLLSSTHAATMSGMMNSYSYGDDNNNDDEDNNDENYGDDNEDGDYKKPKVNDSHHHPRHHRGTGHSSSISSSGGGNRDHYEHQEQQQQYDDYQDAHGVRRPDPIKAQRLVGSHPHDEYAMRHSNMGINRADPPSVDWMFPPPRHLSYPDSFEEAKMLSKSDKKWLLINLQNHDEFASHMLNRDTWSNETVESLIRSNFIFWQRGHLSGDGKEFCQLYSLQPETLPTTMILDPRTGAKVTTLQGYVEPVTLIAFLVEFLEINSLDGHTAPKARSMSVSRERTARQMNAQTVQSGNSSGGGNGSSGGGSGSANDKIYLDDSDDDDNDEVYANKNKNKYSSFNDDNHDDDDEVQIVTNNNKNPTASTLTSSASSSSSSSTNQQQQSVTSAAVTSTSVPVVPPVVAVVVYGDIPTEPAADAANAVKISLKLATGKTIVRRYKSTDKIKVLFAVAAASIDTTAGTGVSGSGGSGESRSFDIVRSFPMESLSTSADGEYNASLLERTIAVVGLAGTQVIMRWK